MIKNIIYSIFTLTLVILMTSSCTEKNDWDVDSKYNRLFSTTKVSASVLEKTDVEISWTATPETQYYIIEISQDSLYDGIDMGTSATSVVFGKDETIKKTPYVISGLEGYTKYYFRIRGLSSAKEGSLWAYPETRHFTTKGEQILRAVAAEDKTDESAILRWDAGNAAVTHIILSHTANGEVVEKSINLTAEDIAKGEILIDGLQESTTYTAAIYNEDKKRGEVSFRTNTNMPVDGATRVLNGTEDLVAYLDTITVSEVTLVLPSGSVYEPTWLNELAQAQKSLRLPENITSITFWGEEGTTQPLIKATAIKLTVGTTKLNFKNVELRGYASNADYVLNESATLPISEITFDGCTVNNFRGVVRLQGASNNTSVSKLSFVDCIVHTIEGYGLIDGAAGTLFSDINIENCTFYDLKEVFIVLKSKGNSLVVKNCTFYNTVKKDKYYFDCKNGDNNMIPATFRVEKCIFGKNYGGEAARATNPGIKTGDFVFDSYLTTDCLMNTGYPMLGSTAYDKSSAELFVDPDNANFGIKDSGFAGKNSVGDPAWWE